MGDERVVLCPGTYDPITLGHLDIVERAAGLFDRVVVGVADRSRKKQPWFTGEERVALAAEAVGHLPNVTVQGFNALVVDFAREIDAVAVIKGLRAISDFDYEFQMAQFNKQLADDIETVYLPASAQYSFLSSSGVREVAAWGGNVDAWVPRNVATALSERLERSGGAAH
jgi:pantetheine-phosphate adenylyltransferase